MTPWKRQLAALWIMQFLAMLGMSQFLPFLPLYLQRLGLADPAAVARWSGVLLGVGFLAAALMAPVWGGLADRVGKKRMVIRAMLGSGSAVALMSVGRGAWDLLSLRVLQGGLGGFVSATTALVASVAPESRVGFAIGSVQSALMAGLIVGPMLGGWLVDAWGFKPLILCSAGLLASGALIVFFAVPEDAPTDHPQARPGIMDNVRFVWNAGPLRTAAIVQFLVQMAFIAVHPVMALLVKDLAVAPAQAGRLTGLAFGATALTTLLSATLLGRQADRWGHATVLRLCLLGAGLAYVPQLFAKTMGTLLGWRALLGLFVGGIQPAIHSIIVRHTPAHRRGGVLGVTFSGSLLGNAVGPVIGGSLAAAVGVRGSFLFTALTTLAAAGMAWRMGSVQGRAAVPEKAAS